jgi:membrane-associated protease RseP (regulator of RpoE activity)
MISVEIIAFIAIFIVAWILLYVSRRRLERFGVSVPIPFFVMYKSKVRDVWFPSISMSKAYRYYERAAVVLSIISMIGGIVLIFYIISEFIIPHPPSEKPALSLTPIIPGITISLSQTPFLLLALGISVALHEIMHALSATSNGIKVRNGGILLLGIFPGAFVEPDEESFNSSTLSKKVKVIAAGIALNLILAAIFFPITYFFPNLVSQGILIESVVKDSAAYNSSLTSGDIIKAVDGTSVNNPYQLGNFLQKYRTNTYTILLPNGTEREVAISAPSHFLGVYVTYYIPSIWLDIYTFVFWMFTINFSLALFNGAPLIITDGGKIFTELLKRIMGTNGEKISLYFQALLILTFVYSILLSNHLLG